MAALQKTGPRASLNISLNVCWCSKTELLNKHQRMLIIRFGESFLFFHRDTLILLALSYEKCVSALVIILFLLSKSIKKKTKTTVKSSRELSDQKKNKEARTTQINVQGTVKRVLYYRLNNVQTVIWLTRNKTLPFSLRK